MNYKRLIYTLIALPGITSVNAAELLAEFDPPTLAGFVGIAVDPASGNLVVYEEFGGATMHVIDQSGNEIGTIVSPGVSSNDYDLDFATGPMTIDGIAIPAGTLLVFNGDDSPERLYALAPDGTVLATTTLDSLSIVGGAHVPGSNTVATVDYTGNDFVRILDANDGTQIGSFNPGPPPFDIFYGDIDLSSETGNITLVSDSQNIVRQITQQGFCVRELNVDPFGIVLMSGVAFDDATGNMWIANRNGTIYHLDPRPDLGDSDSDGLDDFDDNCVDVANPLQVDTDNDGIGNACDADITPVDDNDCTVNFADLNAMKNAFFSTPASPNWNPDADLTGFAGDPDGIVNFLDLNRMKTLFFGAPGPSGVGNLCGCGL
ncbi:MAG: hypothetical protein KJO55_03060 [Gammaproteobacteria bacterium]|nr:hypothetical protein [Gammaproteobacteria bacterium]NND59677.1 hypothetical protein [Gammaproteobacteria bacterium]